MARVKRGTLHLKKRRNLLRHVKGYRHNRSNKLRSARIAFLKAGVNAYRSRKRKKRLNRGLWQLRINAAARENGTTYSRLIHSLKTAGVEMDRKVLSEIAMKHPNVFKKIVAEVK